MVRLEQRPRSDAGRAGPCAWEPASHRGVTGTGEGGSGLEPLRGAELDGLAPPHDAVAVGVVVLAVGAAAVGGKKRRQ